MIVFALAANATRAKTHRMSDGSVLSFTRSASIRRSLSEPITKWDANKTYRVPVILLSFSDCDFIQDDPQKFYDRLFNESGFNLRRGPGCVADYFRDQSGGQFNVVFDVVGPVKSTKTKTGNGEYGGSTFKDAAVLADEQLDYADYDWDGNDSVEVVIYIYAGYGGNEEASEVEGCIWPNTSSFATQNLDGVKVNRYSASPELWSNDASCGIGTICHEFSHALGLPDMYPTSGSEFSVLDEWDLMDGGNFVDDGWCPPNYSIHEREYLGWASAEDLTKTTTVTLMPSYDSSGKAYRIVNDACTSEYYLLENRQKEGWDAMLPNHGLLITHVDFLSSAWTGNSPNSNSKHHRVEYFHADNRDYNDYEALSLKALKYTTYPYTDDDGVVHNALTDGTTPASSLFNKASTGRLFMGKPLLDITESADGLISFNFFSYTDVEGDVNGDGMVDVADVVIITRLIMAGAYCPSADIDDDKEVSAEDIVKATNLIFAK